MVPVVEAAMSSILLLWASPAEACSACQPAVRAIALGPGFGSTALVLLLPLLIIGGVGALVHFSDRLPGAHDADTQGR